MDALALAPAPPPRPLLLRRALGLVRALIDDPARTELVFELVDAVGGSGDEAYFQRFATSRAGRALLEEAPDLVAALADRDALACMPAGSFGRAYLDFAQSRDFAADGLQEVSDRTSVGTLNASLDPERRWFYRRVTAMHDLWHVLTGYATDEEGEAQLLAFSLGQGLGGRGFRLLVLAAAWTGPWANIFAFQRSLLRSWWQGRRAAPLAEAHYEALLEHPLEEVRRQLVIPTPA